jgi:glycosyltransferase involved in cell wall biosynthesis
MGTKTRVSGGPSETGDARRLGVRTAPPRKLCVLVIGPLPEPHNGMTVVTETILTSSLREKFNIVHVDTSDHRSISNVGRLDVTNIAVGLKGVLATIVALAKLDIELVYLPIAKNRLGFLRDAPFLLAARATRRRTLVHFHARGFDEFIISEPWWMRQLIALCLRWKRTDAIVLGECLRGEFERLIPSDRVHVLANGVGDQSANAAGGRGPSPATVLHLSTLWSAKGVFDVLESAARLKPRFPNIQYVLAGDWYSPTEARDAKRYIAETGIRDTILMPGPVHGAVKAGLLATSTLMVFPSRSEGHPLVVLEALSAALPVVTTTVGAIPEMVDDGKEGFLVEPGNVDAITDRIGRLLGDRALRADMSRSARLRYERDFTAESFAERLGAIWESVAGRSCRAVADPPSPESTMGATPS